MTGWEEGTGGSLRGSLRARPTVRLVLTGGLCGLSGSARSSVGTEARATHGVSGSLADGH